MRKWLWLFLLLVGVMHADYGMYEDQQTQREDYSEEDQQAYQRRSCKGCYRQGWKHDRFEEEQFKESSWPSRRGEELSDELGR